MPNDTRHKSACEWNRKAKLLDKFLFVYSAVKVALQCLFTCNDDDNIKCSSNRVHMLMMFLMSKYGRILKVTYFDALQ